MKIAYILHSTTPTEGATKALLPLLRGLIERGCKPFVVAPNANGICGELQRESIPVLSLVYRPATYTYHRTIKDWLLFLPRTVARLWVNRMATNRLAKWLMANSIDIVHTNVSIIDIGYRAALQANIPHVYHLREYGDMDFGLRYFPSKRHFLSMLNNATTYSICITRDIQRHHCQNGNPRSRVIYDGVFPSKSQMPQNERAPFFLYAGRIEPAKGLDLLLKAYADYARHATSAMPLLVAGRDSHAAYYDELKAFIGREQLSDKVKFLGEVTNLPELMQQARALIIPSRHEGFGLCMPEAMFNGCLCIANNTAGSREQMDNGLAEMGEEIALRYTSTSELSRILADVASRSSDTDLPMTTRAFQCVNRLYSTQTNINNVFHFYNHILTT